MKTVKTMEELNQELTIRNINTALGLHLITPEQAVLAFVLARRREQEARCEHNACADGWWSSFSVVGAL